ncbi:hypothetical protein [Plantactinospora alkalitolerans]|uniref:hypothetical protein n=1 Tax=Plantactinospora alkalitolerans TaxID=2789879 RepID=UPI00389AC1CC
MIVDRHGDVISANAGFRMITCRSGPTPAHPAIRADTLRSAHRNTNATSPSLRTHNRF